MKRILSLVLVLALTLTFTGCADKTQTPKPPAHQDAAQVDNVDYGPFRPVGTFAVEEQFRDDAYWAQETPQTELSETFYKAQEEFFDHFYDLWGFKNISLNRADTGRFSDKELLHSVCATLSLEDGSTSTFTKADLVAAGQKYFNQTIEDFSGCSECSYNSETEAYTYANSCIPFPGNYMILRQLKVHKDGLCTAIFDRSHENYYEGAHDVAQDSSLIRSDLLGGFYDGLTRIDSIVVTFYECKSEDGEYFLQIRSISAYTGLGSNTR